MSQLKKFTFYFLLIATITGLFLEMIAGNFFKPFLLSLVDLLVIVVSLKQIIQDLQKSNPPWLKKYRQFYQEHPYTHIVLVMIISSIVGITIEFLLNRDFIGSALYTTLALTAIELFRVFRRRKKDNSN